VPTSPKGRGIPGRRKFRRIASWLSLTLFCLSIAFPAHAGVSQALLDVQERLFLEGSGRNIFPGVSIYEPDFVNAFYELAGYEPVWTDAGYALEMLELLRASEGEGLNPVDYHVAELQDLRAQYAQPWSDRDQLRARAEILLTDGILLYARHLIQGKVDPRTLDESWNYTRRDFDPKATAAALLEAARSRRVAQTLESLKPDLDFYRRMKEALAEYRQLAREGALETVPEEPVLRPGDDHPNVAALQRRLLQMGYLAAARPVSTLFDREVERAVRRLQQDNALDVDGIVGRQSFYLLNLSHEERVDRLRINLDRVRWMAQDISNDFIVVNIAAFELYYIRDEALQWATPVMVGTIDTRTPIFRARLQYLEFNPTWNAPHSIVGRSLLPKFRANPQYAVDNGYRLLDARGRSVDPLSLDWSRYTAANFPYRVVQMPGPANAMGQVKFMFPNRHAVYLHDTPSRSLFYRSQRAFSAGCIRVKSPLELARLMLDDPQRWSAPQIQALVDSGVPRQTVPMQRDVDVMLMYWTVSPGGQGPLRYPQDVYTMDPPALAALDAPPVAAPFSGG
jgi:murein L,D-transpeptidase YcbB/YkuD